MSTWNHHRISLRRVLVIGFAALSFATTLSADPKADPIRVVEYFDNGVRKSLIEEVDGKKTGLALHWYTSGDPMSLHHFKEDVLDGPMIKWENGGNVIAIGEYRDGYPWNGYFLVNPATATPITDTTVHESFLTYFVIRFTDGEAFSALTGEQLDQYIERKPIYKMLFEKMGSGSR